MRLPLTKNKTPWSERGLPYVLVLSLMFGTSLVSARIGLGEFTSLDFIGLRMALSSFAFLFSFIFFSSRFKWPTDPAVWRHGFVLGIIGTAIPMTAFISSLNYLSSGISSIIGTTSPALTVVLAHFLLKDERMTGRIVFGVVLALSGALLLILLGESGLETDGAVNPIGYLLVFTANISSSFGIIYARRYVRKLSPFQITSVRALVTMLIVLPIGLYFGGIDFSAVTYVGYSSLVYSAIISSFAGFILSLYIINQFGVATSVMVHYMIPIVATTTGILLLDEKITTGMLVGMAIIIGGISIINSKKPTAEREKQTS
ncbi:MAG: DMT family transporter [Anaerolineae bacterium]